MKYKIFKAEWKWVTTEPKGSNGFMYVDRFKNDSAIAKALYGQRIYRGR